MNVMLPVLTVLTSLQPKKTRCLTNGELSYEVFDTHQGISRPCFKQINELFGMYPEHVHLSLFPNKNQRTSDGLSRLSRFGLGEDWRTCGARPGSLRRGAAMIGPEGTTTNVSRHLSGKAQGISRDSGTQ